jgi:hypothetical protein
VAVSICSRDHGQLGRYSTRSPEPLARKSRHDAAGLGHCAFGHIADADRRFPPESIGNLSALIAAGTMLFLLLGSPFLARWGPVRTLQVGAVLSALAMTVAATGFAPPLMIASLLLGIGGDMTPARRCWTASATSRSIPTGGF